MPVVPNRLPLAGAFRALPEAARARVAEACRWENHAAGTAIIRHQDTDRDLVILIEGRARVCVYAHGGQPVSFRDIAAGDLVGELSALDGAPRSAFVEALTAARTARLPPEQLSALLAAEPALATALLLHMTALVRDLSDRLVAATSQKADQRIRGDLLRRAEEVPRKGREVALSPAPLHADIAARVGTQREAVSRELGRLSRAGLVRRSGGDLVICDLDALRDLWTAALAD